MSDSCSVDSNQDGEGCAVPTAVSPPIACPSCGKKGKSVDTGTVKALLSVSLHAVSEISPYRFCRTADCPVVYYDETGGTFTEAQVRERVHQKNPTATDVFVCYCYRHTPDSIRDELAATGETTVIATVTAGTKAGTCACDIRNPQGSCCLGNLGKVVIKIKADITLDAKSSDELFTRHSKIR